MGNREKRELKKQQKQKILNVLMKIVITNVHRNQDLNHISRWFQETISTLQNARLETLGSTASA